MLSGKLFTEPKQFNEVTCADAYDVVLKVVVSPKLYFN